MKRQGLIDIPDIELFIDGNERFGFGGTCYSMNYYSYQLLANLGYKVTLCGADMSNPDVHMVSMVELEDRQFLVDVGYAAPFVTPLPRDLASDYVICSGRDQYVLKPQDAMGRSQMELYRDGKLKHGYLAKPAPREIGHFEPAIVDSYRNEATFMNAILLARFFPERSIVIHNLTVIESEGAAWSIQTVANREELVQFITEGFGIPAKITREALDGLELSGDAWN
jgi:arylamine N-acetyltransferase